MPSTTKAAKTAARTRTPCPFSESWNTCAVPWKPVAIVAGRFESRSSSVICVDRVAERDAGREVERDRHRRLLALVVDLQRADRRHQLCATASSGMVWPLAGLHVELLDEMSRRVDAELRLRLQDDLVVVGRRVDGRDLARAEGVEQLLADLIDGDAVDRRLLAVDVDRHLRILDVEVGGDVEQARKLRDLVAHLRREPVERLGVAALQRVLVLALRNPAADVDVLDAAGRTPACPESARPCWRSRAMIDVELVALFFGFSPMNMRP